MVGIVVLFGALNLLVCAVYCKAKKKKDAQRQAKSPVDTSLQSSSGMVARIKLLLAGWIRYSILCLGLVPCHAYRNWILRHVYQMELARNVVLYGGFEIRAPWNITVGEGAVLAAGAVATKDLEPFGIYGGIPAKRIGERSRDLKYEFNGEHIPFY